MDAEEFAIGNRNCKVHLMHVWTNILQETCLLDVSQRSLKQQTSGYRSAQQLGQRDVGLGILVAQDSCLGTRQIYHSCSEGPVRDTAWRLFRLQEC